MSSRVLRKLQGDKEKELIDGNEAQSDIDMDTPVVGGTRKKQLNINRYDLLNQNSHSESEVKEDDNETEAAKSCEGEAVHKAIKKKRKKKKKRSGKHANTHRSSEDNADIDDFEWCVREVNRLLGEDAAVPSSQRQPEKSSNNWVLSIQHKHLNPNNELKRIFGSKIIQSEHKRKSRGSSRGYTKPTWMITCKENWPQVEKSGLSMSLVETKDGLQYFAYEHSQSYQLIELKFLSAVQSLNPNNIVAIINDHPYHVNALIQLSDLCKLSEDLAMAAELIERALYCLEYAFHPLFNVAQGSCRLDYKKQENRALYITIFKHLTFLGGRACCRTSLEFCKLLLSLSPEEDPIAIKLAMDFYALRAKEYCWLLDFVTELDATMNLLQLPNFAFSLPVAYFYLGDASKADFYLQDALLMFPGMLMPLLEECSVQIDSRALQHSFFSQVNERNTPASLGKLITLYVKRCCHIWKDNDILPWFEKNVHEVLDRVDRKEPLVEDYEEKRNRRFAGPLPLSIGRHIILSGDVKGISPFTTESPSNAVFSFDPLPPPDSKNSYKIEGPTIQLSNSNYFATFLESLLPDFNPNQPQQAAADRFRDDEPGQANPDGAPQQDRGDFRRSIASLVDAMRDLLNNIRPEVPNDADVDENDDSADDDLT